MKSFIDYNQGNSQLESEINVIISSLINYDEVHLLNSSNFIVIIVGV